MDTIESTFTNEGQLIIRGRVKGAENVTERTINIEREAPKDDKDIPLSGTTGKDKV